MRAKTTAVAKTVDAYLAAFSEEPRAALERLRQVIHGAAPGATEAISYQIPTFKLEGHSLVGIAAFKNHCSFFPMSVAVIRAHAAELEKYVGGKGTLHFPATKPLPAALVKKIVKARIAENRRRYS